MKRDNIVYWVSTVFFSCMMFLGAYHYFFEPKIVEIYKQMGFPDFLRVEIGTAKIIGAIVLLVPQFPEKVKEWTYSGFGILLLSALIAHIVLHDPIKEKIIPAVLLAVLIVSNIYYSKTRQLITKQSKIRQ